MNITINILEVASELAERDLIKMDNKTIFPNGIYVETEDETSYTEEAQDIFNELYDEYYDFLLNLKTTN
jgi:hypothetical protein